MNSVGADATIGFYRDVLGMEVIFICNARHECSLFKTNH